MACAVEGRGGTRVRERYCAAPFPVHGGKKCTGETSEKGECVDLVRKYVHPLLLTIPHSTYVDMFVYLVKTLKTSKFMFTSCIDNNEIRRI